MEATYPLLFALVVGFMHAFEADHLVAVSNIVSKRDNVLLALKDGIFWGLGHTSTIVLIGLIIIVGKATFLDGYFGYFEAGVGLMLIGLGFYRLYQYRRKHGQVEALIDHGDHHHLAYGVGLIHGVAGSGAMILLVMSQIPSTGQSMLYLLLFGMGSVVGMLVAASLLGLPLSKKVLGGPRLQVSLIWLSSILCIGLGGFIIYENLLA